MDWIISTGKGVFEGKSKRKVLNSMIQHYGENDCDPDTVEAIFVVKKDDKTDELCKKAISFFQNLLDEGVYQWRKEAYDEYRGQQEIERDFYAGLI